MESLVLTAAVAVDGVSKPLLEGTINQQECSPSRLRKPRRSGLECPKRIQSRVLGIFPKMPEVGAGDVLLGRSFQRRGACHGRTGRGSFWTMRDNASDPEALTYGEVRAALSRRAAFESHQEGVGKSPTYVLNVRPAARATRRSP